MLRILAPLAALVLLAACAEPSAPAAEQATPSVASATRDVAAMPNAQNCTFSAGTNSCVFTGTITYTSTHQATKGCLYGPDGIPSAGTLTFLDTYQRTVTTTVLQHGLQGDVYDVSTVVSQPVLVSSQLIGYVCNPPA